MAALNNILKSIEALKILQETTVSSDPAIRKEKISHCIVITEGLCSPNTKLISKYPQIFGCSIKTLLALCDDAEVDVRMIADESLNKIIRAMADSDIVKIQIELYNGIKSNGPARTLRAALWRFSLLSHMIRPTRGKAYVSNLIPCITVIAHRPEESVIDTLAQALKLILRTLGSFMTDNDVKTLLKAFFQNISSTQAAFRRAAANMILTTCLNCRKPQVFLCYVLNYLLDAIIPVNDDIDHLNTVIGVFGCLKVILPYINTPAECEASDKQQLENFLQIYELCLHYTKWHSNHNLINAALETLAQLLQCSSTAFKYVLLSKEGITHSRIELNQEAARISLGQISTSTATSISGGNCDSTLNLLEPEMPQLNSKIGNWIIDSETVLPLMHKSEIREICASEITEIKGKTMENYSELKIETLEGGGVEEGSDAGSEIEHIEEIHYSNLQSDHHMKEEEYLEEASISVASPQKLPMELPSLEINIGNYTDSDMPVKFCCRYLVSSFLLTGSAGHLMPDKLFRVSVKCLALTCVANILRLYPDLLLMTVAKDSTSDKQMMRDILLFANHSDPQIRANVSTLIGSFLKTVFTQYGGSFKNFQPECLNSKTNENSLLENMIKLLIKGLEDDSATTCRQTLTALNLCLPEILNSVDSQYGITILFELPRLIKNPYFLVKVKLADLLSNLSYITIEHITGDALFQQHFIDAIIILLGDQDKRVRHAASEAIVKSIPLLYFQHPQENAVIKKAAQYTEKYLSTVMSSTLRISSYYDKHRVTINNTVKPFTSLTDHNDKKYHVNTEDSLSRIVSILTEILMVDSSKYMVYGCCEALALLSEVYNTIVYVRGWDCILPKALLKKSHKKAVSRIDTTNENNFVIEITTPIGTGLLSLLLPLLSSSAISLDLSTHKHLISLAGNLASGLALCNLKPNEPTNKHDSDTSNIWSMLKDKQMCQYMELLLTHVIKVLNIFVHIIDDIQLNQISTKSLSSLPSAHSLSPKKKVVTEQKQKEKGDKFLSLKFGKEQMGVFNTIPHYMKMYDNLKAAHSNYLVTLDPEASEMYIALLTAILDTLSQILEIATFNEAGRIAEEILYYLQTTVSLSPTATIQCVQQLLKCLFGKNLGSQWSELDMQQYAEQNIALRDTSKGFYNQCFQNPARHMADMIKLIGNNCRDENKPDTGWIGFTRRKGDRKLSYIYSSDHKASVATFIRLFEPMVIKSMEQYTITSNISLQCQVLMLLSQLIQLKVNYCLLDSDKIFIGFVLKQFEFIEEGQIQQAEDLLPKIFSFLVHLSYEKNHSKVVIGIPKIIQLCDGLMASGQPALRYCIPALAPVVGDIFLIRNGNSNQAEQRELETTKEVLISMLLRLVEYHEVIELLALCVSESRFSGDGNGEEKWRRWSRMTTDTILPMLGTCKVRLEWENAHIALVKLFAAISPTVFRPVDPLLKVLFTAPASLKEPVFNLKRWLGMINVILLTLISCAKEESMLARLSDLSVYMTDLSHLLLFPDNLTKVIDPLNALGTQSTQIPPEKILARFIFKVISLIGTKIVNILGLINHRAIDPYTGFAQHTDNDDYLVHQFAFFLQLCIHMFESGSHCKVANAAMQMVQDRNTFEEEKFPIDNLNSLMLSIGHVCPMLTCQWAYLMTLLSYNEMLFWSKILGTRNSNYIVRSLPNEKKVYDYVNSINVQIIHKGGIILFCDYVCENLNDAEPLTWLLVNHIEEAIHTATESPVKELLAAAIHRNPAASGLLVQAISTKCVNLSQPSFIKRLLQCIEDAHQSQSGAVIMMLIPKFLSTKYLALSRMAAKMASRRVEILLTLSAADVMEQLPKNDLVKIMDTLQTTKLAKKHGALVNLLNKLGVHFYDLSPFEPDLCRSFNPSIVKTIQLDRDWFLSQIKLRCCHQNTTYNTHESAQLLSNLNFEDCLSIISSKEFDIIILKDCITLGVRLTIENCQKLELRKIHNTKIHNFEASPLYTAAKQCLLEHVRNVTELMPKPHYVFNPQKSNINSKEVKYATRIAKLLDDSIYWNTLFKIIPVVKAFTKTLSKLTKYNLANMDGKVEEDCAKLALLCFELTHWMIHVDKQNIRKLRPSEVELTLSCAGEILKYEGPFKVFADHTRYSWVCSTILAMTKIVESNLTAVESLPHVDTCSLQAAFQDEETKHYAQACVRIASLVVWLEKCQVNNSSKNIPPYLFNIIKDLIVLISRQPLVNSFVLTPPLVWKHGWHIMGSGTTKCHFPLLSTELNLLQEVDILEQFIYRINLLGWTSRLQFEEIWMALLGLLNLSQNENTSSEESTALVQASCLAIQAITQLLLQTMFLPHPGNPSTSCLIHHSRDPQLSVVKVSSQELYTIQDLLTWKYECMSDIQNINGLKLDHIFHRGNIEKITTSNNFTYSQLSVSYLWSSCNLYEDKLNASVLELKNRRNDALKSASLDVDSCLRFLVELYTSWLSPQANIPIQLLTETMKSLLAISDLFVERAQYQWMLDVCLEISRVHSIENGILHQYLVISVCKAAAVLTPLDLDTLDRVKRLVDINLKSVFLAARVAALHGVLYLLQSAVQANYEEIMNILHPLTIEYIQKHIDTQDTDGVLSQSEEHQGVMWALVFFLLEHAGDTTPDTEAPAVLELVLSLVMSPNISISLHQTLLQGLERLIITKSVMGKVAEQIVKIATERLRHASLMFALPALQLLLTCMYTEAADRLNQPNVEEPLPDIEPESLVRSIERTSAIFDRIKKGYPMEVEILCSVLSGVLADFFPLSQILTKVIGEFLSPQQPHPRLLSGVVFKVCERACTSTQLSLLQDWVVFSLPNFIQSLPLAMSTWCLSCFFISASTNNWLRALFPHVQSRIGKYEYEDKKILCIAANDFYHKLPEESQKKAFVEIFEVAAKEPGTPFIDILASF
ncbi:huntingtin isoform X1 [Vespa velutina]|uniref:huntingtin isoform X1 n=1 Tax=Vespa velutina TaxID=202808 RepID=UPI001FB4DE8A|nr:huntingtin isoform X1 [Vespa velutina]XP_047352946.1 huntingtin isoform X1 [Vespa velutina]